MIHNLKSRMEKMKELINTFSKDLEEIKKKQTEMNNPATEIKNTLEGIYSRKTETSSILFLISLFCSSAVISTILSSS